MGSASVNVATGTIFHRAVSRVKPGRAFGNPHGAIRAAAGLPYAVGGLPSEVPSLRLTFVLAGFGRPLAALEAALALRRAPSVAASEPAPPVADDPWGAEAPCGDDLGARRGRRTATT